MADAFHEIAVAAEDVGLVVHGLEGVVVEPHGQHGLGERHAGGIAATLAERAGRGFDARRMPVFGMPRRFAVPLPETLELGEGEIVAGQVKHGVEEHRAMTAGKNDPVAAGPLGLGGAMFKMFQVENGRDVGHAHGHAGMAGLGLLNAVHGESANGVGRQFQIVE